MKSCRKITGIVSSCFGLAICALFTGCNNIEPKNVVHVSEPKKFDDEFLYFHETGDEFVASLIKWKKDNKNKKIVSICANGSGPYGMDRGYYIVVSDR